MTKEFKVRTLNFKLRFNWVCTLIINIHIVKAQGKSRRESCENIKGNSEEKAKLAIKWHRG